jgi:hypothetical protein
MLVTVMSCEGLLRHRLDARGLPILRRVKLTRLIPLFRDLPKRAARFGLSTCFHPFSVDCWLSLRRRRRTCAHESDAQAHT